MIFWQVCKAIFLGDAQMLEDVRATTRLGGAKGRGLSRSSAKRRNSLNDRVHLVRKLSSGVEPSSGARATKRHKSTKRTTMLAHVTRGPFLIDG